MEALLPSEIARLVLGYLEDQKCNEAARMFLETCPHLQECRTVLSNGRRFSTRVNGMTLIDIVEKFSAINAMIQERLGKISDCEQLKHCGDLLEQLKFLVEETRGQRFVVNINVPSQANSQISNGSPIISSSMRKRRHSNSDRERSKRTKVLASAAQVESVSSQAGSSEGVEATPLESLPGHSETRHSDQNINVEKKRESLTHEQNQSNSNKNTSVDSTQSTENRDKNTRVDKGDDQEVQNLERITTECNKQTEDNCKSSSPYEKCTTATSTEELMSFSCAEVQTTPYDTPESESETNDVPIENLSLLTKELLNRTELQERIAENINKAILPTELSLKDETLNDSACGELNTSIMTELNNAIKSIVEATEADPVFEKFLDEIIGPNTETDTSPDEDSDARPKSKSISGSREKQPEIPSNNVSSPEPLIVDTRTTNEPGVTDVPLKHRLRSSSRQQNTRVEDEVEKNREQEKEQSALEDQNAAAVLSIINANITNNKSNDKNPTEDTRETACLTEDTRKLPTFVPSVEKNEQSLKTVPTESQKDNGTVSSEAEAKTKKAVVKRPRPAKPKRDNDINTNEFMSEEEIMAMPTLIVCSKEEISSMLTANSSYPPVCSITSSTNSRFIPIAPKDPNKINKEETLYLRTVNVAHKVPVTTVSDGPENSQKKSKQTNKPNVPQVAAPVQTISHTTVSSVETVDTKFVGMESITLYGNENSARTLLDGTSMPTISLEENISLSGTGLSPYLKFTCNKSNQNHSLSDIDVAPIGETLKTAVEVTSTGNENPSTSKSADCDIISKRTPRSLLKSRAKNHRLSLSTPRRRSSHIRALDFNTPTKVMTCTKASSENESNFSPRSAKHVKSVCRTSLFKSPPFSGSPMSAHKIKSPLKLCRPCKLPIATRSPAPKLMGGWEKYNGVGVIIGDVSPYRNSSTVSESKIQPNVSKPMKDSWDADLRKALQITHEGEQTAKTANGKKKELPKEKGGTGLKKDKTASRTLKGRGNKKSSTIKSVDSKSENSQDQIVSTKVDEQSVSVSETTSDSKGNNTKTVPIVSSVSSQPQIPSEQKAGNKLVPSKEHDPSTNGSNVTEKKSVKKYAQLKTIKTNLKKFNSEKKQETGNNAVPLDSAQNSEFSKNSMDIAQQILQMPDMIELETPRKLDSNSGIPPTPRLLSPSSNTITPFIKISEDSSKLRSFISTPEFPTTPCIALTPKLVEDHSRDTMKKDVYSSCSPYYRPTSEQVDTSEKLLKLKSVNPLQKSPILSPTTKPCSSHSIISSANAYQTCVSAKLEITQFEVIKENLPKEEAVKELKISSNSIDSTCVTKLKVDCTTEGTTEQVVNEFENVTRYRTLAENERSLFNSYDSTDSDTSSSSDSSSSSSSSSASSSSDSSNTSEEFTANKSCKRVPNKIYTDTSNDSGQKVTCGVAVTNDSMMNLQTKVAADTSAKKHNTTEELVVILTKSESSPTKVFSLTKSEAELKACEVETPAKDESLLNEADISETPSSSKTGIESLTNLTSKISAFISAEDQKLSKAGGSSEHCGPSKHQELPKIANVQHVRSSASAKPVESTESTSPTETERFLSLEGKLGSQLEAKRQRMIAKIRENVKTSCARGRPQQRRTMLRGKSALNTLNKTSKLSTGRHKRLQSTNASPKGKKVESNNNGAGVRLKLAKNPSKITRRGSNSEKQNIQKSVSAEDQSKEDKSKEGGSSTKCSSETDSTTKKRRQSVNKDVEIEKTSEEKVEESKPEDGHKLDDIAEKVDEIESEHVDDPLQKSAVVPEAIGLSNQNAETKCVEEVENTVDNASDAVKEEHNYNEDKSSKGREYANHIEKTKCILKSKVDQVKRDLFSDEENEQRSTSARTSNASKVETDNQPQNVETVTSVENPEAEGTKDLSCVLQCLQLVPAYKNDHANEDETDEQKSDLNATVLNAVEYHFIYDDNAPIRKRRRRYSSHELEFEVNIVLNDEDYKECVKVMTATDYEEMFSISPKSRKRPGNKKSPVKSERHDTNSASGFSLKTINAKPLATSSPLDKTTVPKLKKAPVKNSQTNEKNAEGHTDGKKKGKSEKPQETEKDNTISKSRKRKASESKETEQTEKRQHTTDPQTLLNNLDLDKFLTSVHGPA